MEEEIREEINPEEPCHYDKEKRVFTLNNEFGCLNCKFKKECFGDFNEVGDFMQVLQ